MNSGSRLIKARTSVLNCDADSGLIAGYMARSL